jgi:hypothetical protein
MIDMSLCQIKFSIHDISCVRGVEGKITLKWILKEQDERCGWVNLA